MKQPCIYREFQKCDIFLYVLCVSEILIFRNLISGRLIVETTWNFILDV